MKGIRVKKRKGHHKLDPNFESIKQIIGGYGKRVKQANDNLFIFQVDVTFKITIRFWMDH